jgi:pSer/pThr/pTyr-binding forkhead associated (FHA) protein
LYYFLFKVVRIIYLDLKQTYKTVDSPIYFADNYNDQAKLFLVGNSKSVESIIALNEITSIGRNGSNDIVVDEMFVSSEHACIEKYKQDYWLTDLSSTNGTYVNDCRVTQKVLLKNNDLIRIGAATFRFER